MATFHVNYIFVFTSRYTQKLKKKHFQTPFIYKVSQKTDETFHNHVYIDQNLTLE